MKKLITKNFLIYSLPSILSKTLPLLILPITTKYLSLNDFGYLALFNLCLIPFNSLSEYGSGYVISSNWFKLNQKQRGELLFSLLIVGSFMTILTILFIGFISEKIFSFFVGDSWTQIKPLYPYLLISVISFIPGKVFESWVIIEQRAILSSAIKGLQIILTASTTIMIAIYTQNFKYIIIGSVLVGLGISFIQLVFLIKSSRMKFVKRYYKLIYSIGFPIFLRSIFNQIRTQFDKFIVVNLFGTGQFALYSFSGRFNQMFEEFTSSFQKAYQPSIFKGISNHNLDIKSMKSMLFAWSYFSLIACSLLVIFGRDIIKIFTNGLFVEAYPLVVLYSCVFAITLPFLGNGEVVIFYKKTKYLLFMTVTQAVIIVVFSIILIPKYGATGGIISLWMGTFVYMLLYFFKKRQLYQTYFIEKLIIPYVGIFHMITIVKYFEITRIVNYLYILFIIVMSLHFYYLNKSIINRYLEKTKIKMAILYKDK